MSALSFDYDGLPQRVLFGEGRVADVPAVVALLGGRRVLRANAAGNRRTGRAGRVQLGCGRCATSRSPA